MREGGRTPTLLHMASKIASGFLVSCVLVPANDLRVASNPVDAIRARALKHMALAAIYRLDLDIVPKPVNGRRESLTQVC